jgi:catechol 2,3-dioxygenase-like lactoylglutathione lyase family enzyme
MELAAVRIFVSDLAPAARFYSDVVGLRAAEQGSETVVFGDGPMVIVEAVGHDDEGLVGRFTGVSFETTDAAALHGELSRRGVPTHGSPERQAWGGTLLHADDPSGNTITFVELPRTPAIEGAP